jgi:hypothetical protein
MYRFDSAGRKNTPIYVSFAFSLFLHGAVLFLLASHGTNDNSVALPFYSPPGPIEVLLTHLEVKQVPLAKSQPVHLKTKKEPPPSTSNSYGTQKDRKSSHSTFPRLINLRTGSLLSISKWQGVQVKGPAIRIQLTVNPSGFVDQWKLLTKTTKSPQLDHEAMNHMVRNMRARKTGETHHLVWECLIGEKNGELIAKIYPLTSN